MRKKTKEPKGPSVVGTYVTEIEYDCPVRGRVKQQVVIKRVETVDPAQTEEILPSKSLADELDRKYSGLFLSDDSVDEEEEGQ